MNARIYFIDLNFSRPEKKFSTRGLYFFITRIVMKKIIRQSLFYVTYLLVVYITGK